MQPSSTSPGFKPLSQAGIHLAEGDPIPPSRNNQRMMDRIRAAADDPDWPPMPTLNKTETISDKGHDAKEVQVLPRKPKSRKNDTESCPPTPGVFQGRLMPIQFSCPCCGTVLTVNDPASYRGQPGPCPTCQALISPPRVISPFSVAHPPSEDEPTRIYQGFLP